MSPKKIVLSAKKNQTEFKDFLKNYNVTQMAVGVVVGNAVKDLVSSLANNIIMPMVALFTPSGQWRDWNWQIWGSDFKFGLVIASLLDFLIVALVVFIVIQKFLKIEIEKK